MIETGYIDGLSLDCGNSIGVTAVLRQAIDILMAYNQSIYGNFSPSMWTTRVPFNMAYNWCWMDKVERALCRIAVSHQPYMGPILRPVKPSHHGRHAINLGLSGTRDWYLIIFCGPPLYFSTDSIVYGKDANWNRLFVERDIASSPPPDLITTPESVY